MSDNISPAGPNVWDHQVAIDNSGNTVITWQQNGGTSTQIFKSQYRSGSWTHPSGLSDNISPKGQIATHPDIAMDNSGNTVVAWTQTDGTNFQIFKSEFRSGTWNHPSGLSDSISVDGQNAFYPKIALGNSGDTVITWVQSDGVTAQIFKSEYRAGIWNHPSDLSDNISPDAKAATLPKVAMDNSGNTVITWLQKEGTKDQIFKSEYRSGSWIHPIDLSDNLSPDIAKRVYASQIAMDNSGNTVITWRQFDGTNSQIFKSEYRSGAWSKPADLTDSISPAGGNAYDPQVAMDSTGNTVITWKQFDGTNNQIFKSEYRSGSWTHPGSLLDNISPDNLSFSSKTYIAMNDIGEAVIISSTLENYVYGLIYRNGSWNSTDLELVPNFGFQYYDINLTSNADSFVAAGVYPAETDTQTGVRILEFVK